MLGINSFCSIQQNISITSLNQCQIQSVTHCTCPFFFFFLTNNLNGPPTKYLGLINYLINQPNKPSPLKYPKQLPINYLGLFLKCFDTILEAHNPKHTTQSTRTPYTAPKKPSRPIFKSPDTIHKPKGNSHKKPMNPKYAYNVVIGFKHYWIY